MRAARLPGGSQGLAQAMAKQIKTIKTNARVSAIVQEQESVTVKVGGTGYKADYVVLAVPLPALGKISMTPSLSALQLRALKDINYGWRDQMLLQFKKPVWGKSRLSGEVYSDQGLGMLWVEPALKGGAVSACQGSGRVRGLLGRGLLIWGRCRDSLDIQVLGGGSVYVSAIKQKRPGKAA